MGKKNIHFGEFINEYKVPSTLSKEEAWHSIEAKLALNFTTKRRTLSVHKILVLGLSAASIAAAIIVAILFIKPTENQIVISPEIAALYGETQTVILPDSSSVILNSNSSMYYTYNYPSGERSVMLKGDGFFSVEKGGIFKVELDGASIIVTGTKFYVSSYDQTLFWVDCLEGSVEIMVSDKVYPLTAGLGIKFKQGVASSLYNVDRDEMNDRLEGFFKFERVSIPELIEMVGHRAGYKCDLDTSLYFRYFTGTLNLNNLHESLEIVSIAMKMPYYIDEEKKLINLNAKD